MTQPVTTPSDTAQGQLRLATPNDYAAVVKVMQDAGLSPDAVMVVGTTYWLLEQNGQPVGAIGLEHGEGASLLRGAAVVPSARGQGLGRQLVQSAVEHARQHGDKVLYMFSTGGDWESFHFVQVPLAVVMGDLPDAPQVAHYRAAGTRPGGTTWMRDLS
ncbi:N-acetyltransferase [Deinococcus psychrotolerans]|uniref:GNAT family N-acetyltransferase n=2 Tax=Deinococcus TaxID=1298 RepID=A0A553V2U0_9DEIO|nr:MULTISPECIES: GNAT family N-acetyltransferase [Deinococcus]AZI41538.1 N-acetyltransferase [Deinococcus psychrotolerans]TSA86793.1 GNAT family N-acetyltransferase [Deinococcus detaillensis]